jgi:hypothetical protein
VARQHPDATAGRHPGTAADEQPDATAGRHPDTTADEQPDALADEHPATVANRLPAVKEPHRRTRLETVTTVILAAATVLSAWSAFQAAKWNGVQSVQFSRANTARTESVRASTVSGQQTLGDTSLFTAWLTATEEGQTKLAGRLASLFRGEFKAAFDDWEARSPLTDPSAPATPFDLPSYQSAADRQSNQLARQASQSFTAATTANQRADNYVLMTVLFAIVLFLGAISTRFGSLRRQAGTAWATAALLVAGVVVTATFPVQV